MRALIPVAALASFVACGGKVIIDESTESSGAGGTSSSIGGAGGSSSNGASTSSGQSGAIVCQHTLMGKRLSCFKESGLTPTELQKTTKACMHGDSSIVDSCPSTPDLVGCCESSIGKRQVTSCYYQGLVNVAGAKSLCKAQKGTFTPAPP